MIFRLYKYYSAVKRLMREAQELKDPTEQFSAHPLDVRMFTAYRIQKI